MDSPSHDTKKPFIGPKTRMFAAVTKKEGSMPETAMNILTAILIATAYIPNRLKKSAIDSTLNI